MLTEIQSLGCNQKEAQLYLAALKSGPASISQLAKSAGLKRPTAYVMMDALLERGFMQTTPHGRRTLYQPIAPEQIFATQENSRHQLRQELPQLQALFTKKQNLSRTVHHQGKAALTRVYEDIFRARDIWALFTPEKYSLLFDHKDNAHLFRLLIRHGGRLHDMIPNTPRARKFALAGYRMPNCETRLLPRAVVHEADITVFDDSIAHFSFDQAMCTVITDAALAVTLRSILKIFWQGLETLPVPRS